MLPQINAWIIDYPKVEAHTSSFDLHFNKNAISQTSNQGSTNYMWTVVQVE